MEKRLTEKNIIEIIYNAENNNIDNTIKKINKNIREEIKDINIEKVIEAKNQKKIKEIFDQIEENYNIRISKYNKEIYKQGFIDGVNLIINCLK